MQTKRVLSRLVTGGILGATLLLSAGYWAAPAEARPRRERQTNVERTRGGERGERRDRRVERRVERRDRRVVVTRHRRTYRPRPLVVVRRPWYRETRRVYFHDEPFYFNAGLGLYLGGAFLDFQFANTAPDGYLYYDPFCHETFATVGLYRHHLTRHRHRSVLRVIQADVRLR